MTLQTSGPITLAQIAAEFGGSPPHSLAEYYSGGIYVGSNIVGIPSSGVIKFSDFYGKSNIFAFEIHGNYGNADIYAIAIAYGWNGVSKVQCTIGSDGVVMSTNVGTAACYAVGSFPNGLLLINNGYIVGKGGNGGTNFGGFWTAGGPGSDAGIGLLLSTQTTINNNGVISGGGGGGGACGSPSSHATYWVQSGGGGGGAGYGLGGQCGAYAWGSDGTLTAGGAAGTGYAGRTGGAGGGLGTIGNVGSQGENGGGAGGAGGAAGNAIAGSGNIVSWGPNGLGTIYGAVL